MDKYLRNKLKPRMSLAARRIRSAVAKVRTIATAIALVVVAGSQSHAAKLTTPSISNTQRLRTTNLIQAAALSNHILNNNNPFSLEDFDAIGGAEKHITCFPNPATSYINFKFDPSVAKDTKLFVFSFTGRKMTELSVTSSVLKVTLDNYYRGLYVYQLRSASGAILESGKFQVKN